MCGIWALFSKSDISHDKFGQFYSAFMKIKERGPEFSSFNMIKNNTILGFHRLPIMDLSPDGNQPFLHVRPDGSCVYCICNGEIYDYEHIKKTYNITTKSHSDCEIIIPLYEKVGAKNMMELLGSEFALILVDIDKDGNRKVVVGRDPVGIRPLFYSYDDGLFLSSELKGLSDIQKGIKQFPPGHYMVYENDTMVIEPYFKYDFKELTNVTLQEVYANIRDLFITAVQKRLTSDRPVGALLSGGLDSTLVVGAMKYLMPNVKFPVFTVAFKSGSNDLPFAKEVATYLDLDHHIVLVTEQEALDTIDETIKCLDTFDITTIRASTFQKIIAKYISRNTNIKVLFSGELSDEIFQSYLYFKKAPSLLEGRNEAIRLVKDVHCYDVVRTDRTMAGEGLEVRVPFADSNFVKYIFSLPPSLTAPQNGVEKALLRNAFRPSKMIPDSVCDRVKDAFSDSVSLKERSWFQIIQEHIDTLVSDEEYELHKNDYKHCTPFTKESYYYRKKFAEFTKDTDESHAKTIPYFWMPKWSATSDPSARTLD